MKRSVLLQVLHSIQFSRSAPFAVFAGIHTHALPTKCLIIVIRCPLSVKDFFSIFQINSDYFNTLMKSASSTHEFRTTKLWLWQLKNVCVKISCNRSTEKYPRGRRGGFAKALGRATGARVRIPPSPPSLRMLIPEVFYCLHIYKINTLLKLLSVSKIMSG